MISFFLRLLGLIASLHFSELESGNFFSGFIAPLCVFIFLVLLLIKFVSKSSSGDGGFWGGDGGGFGDGDGGCGEGD